MERTGPRLNRQGRGRSPPLPRQNKRRAPQPQPGASRGGDTSRDSPKARRAGGGRAIGRAKARQLMPGREQKAKEKNPSLQFVDAVRQRAHEVGDLLGDRVAEVILDLGKEVRM